MTCWACDHWFDPIRSRWLCPRCGAKSSCCEGDALPDCD